MFPTINLKENGINLRRIMDKRGITPKDIKEYLNLTSVQSVYNWCSGINMPTIDTNEATIKNLIYVIRGRQVMMDSDLAELYQVEAKVFNQVVKRNMERL